MDPLYMSLDCDKLLFSAPVALENPGKIRKYMGWDGTTQFHSGKSQEVPNFETFPGKPQKNKETSK